MAAIVDNSSLDVSKRNSMAVTLNIHTKSHTVRGRPTLKLVECFGNRLGRKLYERSIYERSFMSEPSIKKHKAKPAHVNTTVYLDVIENPVEYQKLLWNLMNKNETTATKHTVFKSKFSDKSMTTNKLTWLSWILIIGGLNLSISWSIDSVSANQMNSYIHRNM